MTRVIECNDRLSLCCYPVYRVTDKAACVTNGQDFNCRKSSEPRPMGHLGQGIYKRRMKSWGSIERGLYGRMKESNQDGFQLKDINLFSRVTNTASSFC